MLRIGNDIEIISNLEALKINNKSFSPQLKIICEREKY